MELFKRADRIEPISAGWFLPGYIPNGCITAIEGHGGEGKSTLLFDLVTTGRLPTIASGRTNVTSGVLLPGSNAFSTALWLSSEEPEEVIINSLIAAGADRKKVFIFDKARINDVVLPNGIGNLADAINDTGARIIVFDPISSFVSGGGSNEHQVRSALTPLASVAEKLGVAVLAIRHLRKSPSGSAITQGLGTVAWNNAARGVLRVGLHPGSDTQRVLAITKVPRGPDASMVSPSLGFNIVAEGVGVRVEWAGPVDVTADQLNAGSGAASSERAEAIRFLFHILRDGPMWAGDAKKTASEAGITATTLRRAREDLGVITRRRGQREGARVFWRLPPDNEILEALQRKDMEDLMDDLMSGRREPDQYEPAF